MAIGLRGSATAASDQNGGSVTVTMPGGVAQNDVAIAADAGESADANEDLSVSTSGYTEVADLFQNDTRDSNLGVFLKVQGPTPDTTVVFTGFGNVNEAHVGAVYVLTGVDTTNPQDVTATTAGNVNGGTPDNASITPVTANAWVIAIAGSSEPDVPSVLTNYSDLVTLLDTDATNVANIMICRREIATPAAEDPPAWSDIVGATSDAWNAVTLAMRPAAASADPFEPVDLANPAIGARRGADLRSWVNGVNLALNPPPAPGTPFSGAEMPLPICQKRSQSDGPPNILLATLTTTPPDTTTVLRQPLFVRRPQQSSAAALLAQVPQDLLPTLLATPAGVPFSLDDWSVPQKSRDRDRGFAAGTPLTLTPVVPVPVLPVDVQVRQRSRFQVGFEQEALALTVPPGAPPVQPVDLQVRQPSRFRVGFEQEALALTVPPGAAPTLPVDLQVRQPSRFKVGFEQAALALTVPPGAPPVLPIDLSLPQRKRQVPVQDVANLLLTTLAQQQPAPFVPTDWQRIGRRDQQAALQAWQQGRTLDPSAPFVPIEFPAVGRRDQHAAQRGAQQGRTLDPAAPFAPMDWPFIGRERAATNDGLTAQNLLLGTLNTPIGEALQAHPIIPVRRPGLVECGAQVPLGLTIVNPFEPTWWPNPSRRRSMPDTQEIDNLLCLLSAHGITPRRTTFAEGSRVARARGDRSAKVEGSRGTSI